MPPTGREHRGYDRAARMRARGVVRVVGLIRMRHDSIGERGIDRRGRSAEPAIVAAPFPACERM